MLKEMVRIKTATTNLKGVLYVGLDGLPELLVNDTRFEYYRPWNLPAAWLLEYVLDPAVEPILYPAWQAIERIQRQIADAQREAEAENKKEV